MFKRLQMKMTLTYTLILIGVLLATNVSIYLIMANYNSYQLSTEIQRMLGSIGSSEWLYEQDAQATSESDEDEDHDEEAPSKLVNLPSAKELVIPQTLNTFQFYMVFNAEDQLIQQKSDNKVIFDKLLTESKNIAVSGAPTVVALQGSTELHYLIGKMPIVVDNETLGYYVVARDVTVAFENPRQSAQDPCNQLCRRHFSVRPSGLFFSRSKPAARQGGLPLQTNVSRRCVP